MRARLYYPLFYLFLLLCPSLLSAQETTPVDTLSLSPYERASKALAHGDYDAATACLEGLSKKEKGRFDHKMLAVALDLARFDTMSAQGILDGIKPKEITDSELYDRLSTLLQREERMLQSGIAIRLIGEPVRASLETLKAELSLLAKPAGEITEKSFTAAGGQVRWQVLRKGDGRETFGIVYRLGDGTWDESHIEEVSVLGLDSLGRFSYPFLLSDGETLYFSYSGPETLGGRDIYLSRYNASEHTLLVPQQLPIPINSPAGDYGYIFDESAGIGVFITERNSREGEGTLVKYRIQKEGIFPADRDSVADYAFFRGVPAYPDEKPFGETVSRTEAAKTPLFWVKDRAVYSADDLQKGGSRDIFARFLSLTESYKSEKARLEKLRDEYGKNTSAKASVSSEILALERELRSRRSEIKALRNEVIKNETL